MLLVVETLADGTANEECAGEDCCGNGGSGDGRGVGTEVVLESAKG